VTIALSADWRTSPSSITTANQSINQSIKAMFSVSIKNWQAAIQKNDLKLIEQSVCGCNPMCNTSPRNYVDRSTTRLQLVRDVYVQLSYRLLRFSTYVGIIKSAVWSSFAKTLSFYFLALCVLLWFSSRFILLYLSFLLRCVLGFSCFYYLSLHYIRIFYSGLTKKTSRTTRIRASVSYVQM